MGSSFLLQVGSSALYGRPWPVLQGSRCISSRILMALSSPDNASVSSSQLLPLDKVSQLVWGYFCHIGDDTELVSEIDEVLVPQRIQDPTHYLDGILSLG